MKEISKVYKMLGFGLDAEYCTFVYPDGSEVKFPNPDICNIKYTKQIVSGATYDIPI